MKKARFLIAALIVFLNSTVAVCGGLCRQCAAWHPMTKEGHAAKAA